MGDKKLIGLGRWVFKEATLRRQTLRLPSRSPSRFGRGAACCGVGSYCRQGRSLLRGRFLLPGVTQYRTRFLLPRGFLPITPHPPSRGKAADSSSVLCCWAG